MCGYISPHIHRSKDSGIRQIKGWNYQETFCKILNNSGGDDSNDGSS